MPGRGVSGLGQSLFAGMSGLRQSLFAGMSGLGESGVVCGFE